MDGEAEDEQPEDEVVGLDGGGNDEAAVFDEQQEGGEGQQRFVGAAALVEGEDADSGGQRQGDNDSVLQVAHALFLFRVGRQAVVQPGVAAPDDKDGEGGGNDGAGEIVGLEVEGRDGGEQFGGIVSGEDAEKVADGEQPCFGDERVALTAENEEAGADQCADGDGGGEVVAADNDDGSVDNGGLFVLHGSVPEVEGADKGRFFLRRGQADGDACGKDGGLCGQSEVGGKDALDLAA